MGNELGKQKVVWTVVLVACSLAVVLFQLFFTHRINSGFSSHMQEQRKNSVSKMVHLAANTTAPIVEKVRRGELDSNTARGMIADIVRRMTYTDEHGVNYIFMSTYEGIMLVQPFEPAREGMNQWELKDAKGNFIIQALVKAAKEKPAGSYVTYWYYPPGSDQAEEKLSYVIGIPEINAYIGTGMYIESSYKELGNILERQRAGFLAFTIFILLVIMLYSRELAKSNQLLKKEINDRKLQYNELQKTQTELQSKHDELTSIYEELAATEEELRFQYEEKKKHEEEIRHLAFYDYLTDLPNRVSMVNNLENRLEKCSLEDSCGTIFYIDVDNFKEINDTFGHFYGDAVLVELAGRLKALSNDELTIARIGGDEFIVLQEASLSEVEIKHLAEKVLELFADPVLIRDNSFQVTCSIGIALYPKDGATVEEVMKNADLAMYKAKAQGKNKYIFYNRKLAADLAEKTELEKHLRSAFSNREFILYYQPQTDAIKGKTVGLEALLRWNSPVYGMVSPARFIPVAEEMGLIYDIGRWVIDQSFSFARNFQNTDICVSCNVSSMQLLQGDFVQEVLEAFSKYNLKKGSVALEITETSLIESFTEVTEKLAILRGNGIPIYLDDFGTGYSSLTYLKNLPIDVVKIDKSFIDNITHNSVEQRIVRTVISLAREIGLKVVAEGVETHEQLEQLALCNCDFIQGYLISKPKPEMEIENFLEK